MTMKRKRFNTNSQARRQGVGRLVIVIALFSLFAASPEAKRPADSRAVQTGGATALVCVVSGSDPESSQNNMDAVVMIENGKLRQPYPEYNEAARQQFAGKYFTTGKNYRVTFGGGEVGTATVKSFDTGCNNIHATVNLEDNGKIPPRLSALATDSDLLGRKPSARRPPIQPEREAMMRLVNQVYGAHKTAKPLFRLITTSNLTATDLNGDGKFEMIGSFVIQTVSKNRRDLFLIAEPAGNNFKVGFEKFQAYRLQPEQFDSAVDFVDQLDLDGDGTGEVFVRQHGFDAYGYSIYKKTRGRWIQVFTAAGDAC
jgi:hypothetical protein